MSCSNKLQSFDAVDGTRVAFTSASLLEAHDYYPFGQDMVGRSSAGAPVRQGFTGYWRDHEAGLSLYYAGARQYDPTSGRFFGVDPLAEDFPTWSGYAYTLNDPVRWRDPDGRCPVGSQAGDIHDGSVCMQEIVVTAERIRNDGNSYSSSALGLFALDALTLEPTDAIIPKWLGWGLVITGAIIIDHTFSSVQIVYSHDRKLNDWEIKKLEQKLLEEESSDIHDGKGNKSTGKLDYWVKPDGTIVIKPKGGRGPGEPTGFNIRDL